jgi:hypothetical protein
MIIKTKPNKNQIQGKKGESVRDTGWCKTDVQTNIKYKLQTSTARYSTDLKS